MEGLKTASSFHRFLIALSVGALAFSFSFATGDNSNEIGKIAKFLLIGSWFALALSVIGGLVAEARVVTKISSEDFSLEDQHLKRPALTQVFLFGFGILFMAIALMLMVF